MYNIRVVAFLCSKCTRWTEVCTFRATVLFFWNVVTLKWTSWTVTAFFFSRALFIAPTPVEVCDNWGFVNIWTLTLWFKGSKGAAAWITPSLSKKMKHHHTWLHHDRLKIQHWYRLLVLATRLRPVSPPKFKFKGSTPKFDVSSWVVIKTNSKNYIAWLLFFKKTVKQSVVVLYFSPLLPSFSYKYTKRIFIPRAEHEFYFEA